MKHSPYKTSRVTLRRKIYQADERFEQGIVDDNPCAGPDSLFHLIHNVIGQMNLSSAARNLYYELCSILGNQREFRGFTKGDAFLAEILGYNQRTISRAKAELVERGLIYVFSRRSAQKPDLTDKIVLLNINDFNLRKARRLNPKFHSEEISDDEYELLREYRAEIQSKYE